MINRPSPPSARSQLIRGRTPRDSSCSASFLATRRRPGLRPGQVHPVRAGRARESRPAPSRAVDHAAFDVCVVGPADAGVDGVLGAAGSVAGVSVDAGGVAGAVLLFGTTRDGGKSVA